MDRVKITRDEAGTYWLQSATDRKDVIACIQSRDPRMDAFVRAVNSHAELVAALREIVNWHRLAVEGKDRSINSALGYIDHMGMAASSALAKAEA